MRKHSANAGVAQCCDRGIGVLGRVLDLRPVDERGATGFQGAHRAEQVARINVFRLVMAAKVSQHLGAIGPEPDIAHAVAQRGLPGVPVRIDETGQDNEIRRIDMLRVRHLQLRRDRCNPSTLDQDVAAAQVADRAIHAEDAAAR